MSPGYVTTPPPLPLSSAMKKGKAGKAVTIQEDNLGSGESAGEEAHRAAMVSVEYHSTVKWVNIKKKSAC